MIARHLTSENHVEVLAAARRRTKTEIESLVARLAPKPDAKPVIRRLADPRPMAEVPSATPTPEARSANPTHDDAAAPSAPPVSCGASADRTGTDAPGPTGPEVLSRPASTRRPVIRASAPARFLVQLTVGQETHDRFRRLQALCARECQGGDPVAVFDLVCLVAEKEMLRRKRAAVTPRGSRSGKKARIVGPAAAHKPRARTAVTFRGRQPRGVGAGRRALRVRRPRRPVHGDEVPRVAPPDPVGARRPGDDRQPRGPLPAAQRLRSGAGLRRACGRSKAGCGPTTAGAVGPSPRLDNSPPRGV